jgi:hypothetical protein
VSAKGKKSAKSDAKKSKKALGFCVETRNVTVDVMRLAGGLTLTDEPCGWFALQSEGGINRTVGEGVIIGAR